MLNVREGITTGPEQYTAPGDQEQIRAQTAASRAGIDTPGEDIRAAMFGDDPSSVKAGLVTTTADEAKLAEYDESATAARRRVYAGAIAAAEERDRELLAEYRKQERLDNYATATMYGDEEEEILAWTSLQPAERVELVEQGDLSVEDARALDARAEQATLARGAAKLLIQEGQRAVEAEQAKQALFAKFVADNGISDEEASLILNEAQAATGLDLMSATPDDFRTAVTGTAFVMNRRAIANEEAAMKQQILDSDTSIASGLTQSIPGRGHMPLNPTPTIEPKVNLDGIDRFFDGKTVGVSAQEIRAAVAAPSPLSVGDEGYAAVQRRGIELFGGEGI